MCIVNNDPNNCSAKGVLLPLMSEESWRLEVRATLYIVALLWLFLAVALVADTFMCGIERITSKTRIIRIQDPTNKDKHMELEVKVWNDTVANLTLMAFGTSAPEILLSVIETVSKGFVAGELGPGTIVGSAAFNLLVITSVCIVAIPKGETRRVKNLQVYVVTTFWGLFAYVWLLIVLIAVTPNQVDLWEGIVTFLMFPALVITAYIADKKCSCRSNRTSSTGEVEIGIEMSSEENLTHVHHLTGRVEIISLARELGRLAENAQLSEEEVARMTAARLSAYDKHSSAWYRVNTMRSITAQASHRDNLSPELKKLIESEHEWEVSDLSEGNTKAVVEFTTRTCAVLENEGQVRLGVRRYGNMKLAFRVKVETIDGTAEAGSDYVEMYETLQFKPDEKLKDIYVKIIDDDVWEPDEFFYVKLCLDVPSTGEKVVLGHTPINTVTIVNDDEPGKFEFVKPSYIVKESADTAQLEVKRVMGADGKVEVKWRTLDGTATNGHEFKGGEGKLVFNHGETSQIIRIPIHGTIRPLDDEASKADEHEAGPHIKHNKEPHFSVELYSPSGGALIGRLGKTIITIINDEAFEGMVSRIAEKAIKDLQGFRIDGGTWGEQFYNAFNVNEGDREKTTAIDYIMHVLTFFWKVLFAFIPPPSICGGWLTFILSLMTIGFLTAIISDVASIFGCLVGLSDTVTAITLVALGTSMPDLFASKAAAINERHADDSIGNVNGSNAVNVFLGLGLPWVIASIYWSVQGKVYMVPAGSVTFSVVLFAGAAVVCVTILMLRRGLSLFGKAELGGPTVPKCLAAIVISTTWIIYIIASSLQAMNVIQINL